MANMPFDAVVCDDGARRLAGPLTVLFAWTMGEIEIMRSDFLECEFTETRFGAPYHLVECHLVGAPLGWVSDGERPVLKAADDDQAWQRGYRHAWRRRARLRR